MGYEMARGNTGICKVPREITPLPEFFRTSVLESGFFSPFIPIALAVSMGNWQWLCPLAFPVGCHFWLDFFVDVFSHRAQSMQITKPTICSIWMVQRICFQCFLFAFSPSIEEKSGEGAAFASDNMACEPNLNGSCNCQASMIQGLGRGVPMQSLQCGIFCVLWCIPTRLAWLTSAVPSLTAHREQ